MEIFIVQKIHGGLAQEPFVTRSEEKAFGRYVELVTEQGMRKPLENETFEEYIEAYDDAWSDVENRTIDTDDEIIFWETVID